MEKDLVKLDDVINLLIEEEILIDKDIIKTTKPSHGPCCTCQKCGYYHDECVCYHNDLMNKLKNLRKFIRLDSDQSMD